MEKREQLVLTFYNPKVPKLKGNRNYQRVRRYLITIRSDGRKRTYLKVGLDSVLEIEKRSPWVGTDIHRSNPHGDA